ncbi:hypothetical protein ACLBXM_00270 [Xanthobacteraceae bacterium A53D]
MTEGETSPHKGHLTRIEPAQRLVMLARTLHVGDAVAEGVLQEAAGQFSHLGAACIGRSLYRHRAIFRSAVEAPVWSHLELSYFRDLVPAEIIRDLVRAPQPDGVHLLRAEILLTTPSAFVLPQDWQGLGGCPGRQASIEYIDVRPADLGAYRAIMRDYIGPAAAKLVEAGKIGTFRTMETAAVLHQDPALTADWNQIHLSEVEAEGFDGFGAAFDAALRDVSPDGAFAALFAGLDQMRTIPRWTFNDAVVEADGALARFDIA